MVRWLSNSLRWFRGETLPGPMCEHSHFS
ncbi:rCG36991 [Rattus norvegicus]|uniref:RCG36991 n=1 Tax=Rattus norvegicus TaxID=10116 RepID=A6HUJ2_RAT|nr:rCG36991 [Rattus norvegicus]